MASVGNVPGLAILVTSDLNITVDIGSRKFITRRESDVGFCGEEGEKNRKEG